MNKLSRSKRTQIIHLLCEGMSMRGVSRVAGCSMNTVTKILVDAGTACKSFQDELIRDVNARRVQCDEIWSFIHAKKKNVPTAKNPPPGAGDVWTWVAIDADTKLIICHYCGGRELEDAKLFIQDLRSRLSDRVQLTTDGLRAYVEAVDESFGKREVDFSQLVKQDPRLKIKRKKFLSPHHELKVRMAQLGRMKSKKTVIRGRPDLDHVSTSFVERHNLTMRMNNKRFGRLTNAHSKKLLHHDLMMHIYSTHYNWCRNHGTLGCTPVMAAGIDDFHYTNELIPYLMEVLEKPPNRPKRYRKRSQQSN